MKWGGGPIRTPVLLMLVFGIRDGVRPSTPGRRAVDPGVRAVSIYRRPVISGLASRFGSPSSRRLASIVVTSIILGIAVALLVGNVGLMGAQGAEDFMIYRRHTSEWLAGGSLYDGRQLAGPYTVQAGDSLYPPPFALVMLPFLVLPAALWWAIPIVTLAWVVFHHRPQPWTWPLIALCVAAPRTLALTIYGNPTMWVAMAVAAGTVWRWPAAFAILRKECCSGILSCFPDNLGNT